MAIFASIFAALGRFAGRILTTTLGWASTMLFGRIPEERQAWFAVLTFGSIVWVALVVGVIFPDVGAILLAFVPLPDWVSQDLVRIAMLIAAVGLPLVLGAVTLLIAEASDRPQGKEMLVAVLRGYLLTPVLAATLVLLAGAGIVRKVQAVIARRETAHIPIVVRPGRYDALVEDLEEMLRKDGLVTERKEGSAILTRPAKLLASISATGLGRLVPDRLAVLKGPDYELEVYPSDLSSSGQELPLARARATIMRDLSSRDAWFTTTRDAQAIEDRLAMIENPTGPVDAATLKTIDHRLASEALDDDAWDVLYRRRLQVTAAATGTDVGEPGGPEVLARRPRRRGVDLGTVLGALTAALVIVDLVLAVRRPEAER